MDWVRFISSCLPSSVSGCLSCPCSAKYSAAALSQAHSALSIQKEGTPAPGAPPDCFCASDFFCVLNFASSRIRPSMKAVRMTASQPASGIPSANQLMPSTRKATGIFRRNPITTGSPLPLMVLTKLDMVRASIAKEPAVHDMTMAGGTLGFSAPT